MSSREKKSEAINKNYPVLGFRVAKADRDDLLVEFEELLSTLRNQPEYRRVNLKKNAVFLRALELGIGQLKKKKTLG